MVATPDGLQQQDSADCKVNLFSSLPSVRWGLGRWCAWALQLCKFGYLTCIAGMAERHCAGLSGRQSMHLQRQQGGC